MLTSIHDLWLVPLGFFVGAFGTLIGAGGGFLLLPILVLMYPRKSPETLTSISLAVVFINALSGTVAYGRMRRIDYRSGTIFAIASVPGAVLGALTTRYLARHAFDAIFGCVMLAISAYLLARPNGRTRCPGSSGPPRVHQHLDAGKTRLGIAISAVVGYVSSLLGIGGGIIHVPAMVQFLGFPVHVATATSHYILMIMALSGTCVHLYAGSFRNSMYETFLLSVGVLVGAPLGARLSSRIKAAWIMRALAVALAFVAIRVLLQAR